MISVPNDEDLSSCVSMAHTHCNGMLIYCLLTLCSLALRSIYQHANTYKYKVWLLTLRLGAAVPDLEFSPEVWLLNNKNVHAALDLGYISLK
jgi:hypothetical protein